VVGQRGQHRFEHPYLPARRPLLGGEPERQLAEPDLAHDVLREVLAQQRDLLGGRGPERRLEIHDASHFRSSSPCSSSSGGGNG
jgi:hypothetical protein